MSLVHELEEVIKGCNAAGVEYALCGGLSLAIHGLARATVDIDMLVQKQDINSISQVAQSCGFNIPAMDMTFSQGAVEMKRFTKITTDGSVIPIDFLIVTPELQSVWDTRETIEWNSLQVTVASRDGLVMMKQLSGRPQDLADIARLQDETSR